MIHSPAHPPDSVTPKSGFRKPPLRVPARRVREEAPDSGTEIQEKGSAALKRLVWLYFWLLIFEGALRKWFLPQLSAPLLIIRDPVVIGIYLLAKQQGLTPRHSLYNFFLFQAVAGAILAVSQYILLGIPPSVLVYGYRTLFLHFPLVFLLPYIFTYEDVVGVGKWLLVLSLPMALLMAWQFRASPDAWINRTAGAAGTLQITSAFGKIRPPGTFSFVSGSVAFFALVTAFTGYGLVSGPRAYPRALLAAAAVSIGLAVAVSGSRATILSGAIVVLAWVLGAVAGRRVSTAAGNSLIVVVVAVLVLGQVDLFREGTEVLNERIELAREAESGQGGITGRFMNELLTPLRRLPSIPLFGVGLGVGTNVGSSLLTGKVQFLISEGEWGRVLFEMGPVFGLLYLALRVALVVYLGRESLAVAREGHLLPILVFSACAVGLFSGQIAQPTTLGFTVLGASLCWAALKPFQRLPFARTGSANFQRIPLINARRGPAS